MSVRWLHCLDHADNIQKPAESPDCLHGVVTQPTDSRLSETSDAREIVSIVKSVLMYAYTYYCNI